MTQQGRDREADGDPDRVSDPADPPESQGSPKYLKLLAVPVIIILILAVIGLFFYLRQSSENPPGGMEQIGPPGMSASPSARLALGPPVPTFEARAMAGEKLKFPNDYRGKLVLLDFWATWCRPCVIEIPNLVETYHTYRPLGLEVVGVTLDRIPPEKVQRFVQNNNASWPQIYENAWGIAQQFQVGAIPAAFLVDGDTGRLVASGEALRGSSLRATIEKCLEQKKGTQ